MRGFRVDNAPFYLILRKQETPHQHQTMDMSEYRRIQADMGNA
jgi:hypothetical protein